MDTVFLDAHILFSAAYRSDTGIRRLWELADVVLVTSAYAVAEARRNLETPERRAALEKLLATVKIIAVTSSDSPVPSSVELPDKDRPILTAAIDAQATHLLTGDARDFGKYYGQTVKGVLILPPAEYLCARLKA